MTDEEVQEILEDMRQEYKKELWEEEQLRIDEEYAIDKFVYEITTAHEILQDVCDTLDGYGWEYTPSELLDRI